MLNTKLQKTTFRYYTTELSFFKELNGKGYYLMSNEGYSLIEGLEGLHFSSLKKIKNWLKCFSNMPEKVLRGNV